MTTLWRRPVTRSDVAPVISRFFVDLNTADPSTLCLLPGIGPSIADRIVLHRERHGPFSTLRELADVSRVGQSTLERMRPLAFCGPGTARAEIPE